MRWPCWPASPPPFAHAHDAFANLGTQAGLEIGAGRIKQNREFVSKFFYYGKILVLHSFSGCGSDSARLGNDLIQRHHVEIRNRMCRTKSFCAVGKLCYPIEHTNSHRFSTFWTQVMQFLGLIRSKAAIAGTMPIIMVHAFFGKKFYGREKPLWIF